MSPLYHSHSLIPGVGCRVKRPGSRWMQSSTSSVQQSIRRTWRTFSERPPRKLWPFNENRRPTRGRRNVWFCKLRRKRNMVWGLHPPPGEQHRWTTHTDECSVSEGAQWLRLMWKWLVFFKSELLWITSTFTVKRKMMQQERQFCKLQLRDFRGVQLEMLWIDVFFLLCFLFFNTFVF